MIYGMVGEGKDLVGEGKDPDYYYNLAFCHISI